jgi:hypothetical protein
MTAHILTSLFRNGRFVRVTATKDISALTFNVRSDQFATFGIPTPLRRGLYGALHRLASSRAEREGMSPETAFVVVVGEIKKAGRTHGSTGQHVHFIGLAECCGVRFATVADAVETLDSINHMVRLGINAGGIYSGGSKSDRLYLYWQTMQAAFLEIGRSIDWSNPPQNLNNGLTASFCKRFISLMEATGGGVASSKLLSLMQIIDATDLNGDDLVALLKVEPSRADDLIELLNRGALSQGALDAFLSEPELWKALRFDATLELIEAWDPEEGLLLEAAQGFAEELWGYNEVQVPVAPEAVIQTAEEPEPDPEEVVDSPTTVPLDHKLLDIGRFISDRFSVEAIQILLVYGVLTPDQPEAAMLDGAILPKNDFLRPCLPKFKEAGVNDRDGNKALQLLGFMGILRTHLKPKRIEFNTDANSTERVIGILDALEVFQATIERPQ